VTDLEAAADKAKLTGQIRSFLAWLGEGRKLTQTGRIDDIWVNTTPEQMAADTLAGFPVRFEWALDDLRGLVSGRPLIAEGWGLRPELVAPIIDSPRRMVVMIATEEFRRAGVAGLAAAGWPHGPLYVHLDLDVIDPSEVPGLRYPAPGGPSAAEVGGALRTLLGSGQVAAVGMACTWYPGHGAAARIEPGFTTIFAA
jgi:hypothetical protein